MHAYTDAIRRTGGAYVLYPGDKSYSRKGFHEIIPGLGAFPVKPSKSDNGIGELKGFILEIIDHFINRSSQREKIAYRTFDIYKTPPEADNAHTERLPESFNENRALIPDDTVVLVGSYKSREQLNWIKSRALYNFRMEGARGSLTLTKEALSSKFLVLHTKEDESTRELWRIVEKGFKVTSRETLERLGYPNPGHKNYLIVRIEKVSEPELENVELNFKKLVGYSPNDDYAFPFTATLSELMTCRKK
jgi:hypothetical protein